MKGFENAKLTKQEQEDLLKCCIYGADGLRSLARPKKLFHPGSLAHTSVYGDWVPLWFILLRAWDADRLRRLLKIPGFDVNQRDSMGPFLFYHWPAASHSGLEFLELLLRSGYDAKATSNSGHFILEYRPGAWIQYAKLLMDYGCRYPGHTTALIDYQLEVDVRVHRVRSVCVIVLHNAVRLVGSKDVARLIARRIWPQRRVRE